MRSSSAARELRETLGLTQLEAAEIYGVSQATISALETGRKSGANLAQYYDFLRKQAFDIRTFRRRRLLDAIAPEEAIEKARLWTDHEILESISSEWALLGSTRSSRQAQLLFLFHVRREQFGIASLYQHGKAKVRRAAIVVVEDEFAASVLGTMLQFFVERPRHSEYNLGTAEHVTDDDIGTLLRPIHSLKQGGWEERLLHAIEGSFDKRFTLEEVYELEPRFRVAFEEHQDVRAGLRQTLQRLRDRGYVRFLGNGEYERVS